MRNLKTYFYLLPSVLMIVSGLAKLFLIDVNKVSQEMTSLIAIKDLIKPIGMLEISCAIIFLIPKTMNMGFFLICSYWGGAIAVDIVNHSPNPLTPCMILALFWVGFYFKKGSFFLP